MSENTRPQDHVELHLLQPDGDQKTVKCTIGTPTIKRGREYRRLQRQILIQTKIYQEKLKTRLRQDESEESKSTIESELDSNDTATFDLLTKQCAAVINIPNTSDGTPREASAIDWENSDLDEIKRSVDFFGERLNASSSDT